MRHSPLKLVIVESPTKAKALRGFLGRDYRVLSTLGHIRDLPPKKLGVDVERDFAPTFWFLRGAKKRATQIKEAVAEAAEVYLATDPDREGEAIAWHVSEVVRPAGKGKQLRRITFHEITGPAVRAALARPCSLDEDLVDAQQARRILDRLVGYQVSPVLWKAVVGPKGLSAGRVQTVALRLVVDRDREIESFDPQEYWLLEIELCKTASEEQPFRARLVEVSGEEADLKGEEQVQSIVDEIETADYHVSKVTRTSGRRYPYPPYITSTLQQDAAQKLHWSASKTMRVAQQLYEGLNLPEEGTVGLITYMRTDSSFVAASAQEEARQIIDRYWGSDCVPEHPPGYQARSKVAQEAHEAIRPTSSRRTPTKMRRCLTPDQSKLYEWIWRRFIASQMEPAAYTDTTVEVSCAQGGAVLPYLFRASGRELEFDGFMRVYPARWSQRASRKLGAANQDLPPLILEEPLLLQSVLPDRRFTEPPPHFTESSLIKELDKRGIGRPSTYAGIVRTLFQRQYVKRRAGSLLAQPLGLAVCDFLVGQFPLLFEVSFTAGMEEQLDLIARGERGIVDVLSEFYQPFHAALATACQTAQDAPVTVPEQGREAALTGERCPDCGGDILVRRGKHGEFRGCSGFPECKWTGSVRTKPRQHESSGDSCPECKAAVVVRQGRYGRFRACSSFPECRWSAPLGVGQCPKCDGSLVERRAKQGIFWGCSNSPDCRYRQRPEPRGEEPRDGSGA